MTQVFGVLRWRVYGSEFDFGLAAVFGTHEAAEQYALACILGEKVKPEHERYKYAVRGPYLVSDAMRDNSTPLPYGNLLGVCEKCGLAVPILG